ncbi:MAG: exo-alpha-sialidase [Candidatus Eisenbacteria bacterium]|uniref:Exo-alpha-sialidase n=1 Tax=Eiseniibacteriota bacterium TaxID=2212470 RepID=A0A538UDP6_UNCEI|nr:MAG: exo-alpha-sialidase [Candidatus Eisenbacteria bacterium]
MSPRRASLLLGLVLLAFAAGLRDRPAHAGGGAPAPKEIATPGALGAKAPSLTVLPDGRVLMSWIEPRAAGGVALRCATLGGGQWSSPATIAEGDSVLGNWANFPVVQALGGNRLAVSWLWMRPGGSEACDVRVSQSEDGGRNWSDPVTTHRDATPTEHGFASLVARPEGALAVWLDGRKTVGHQEGDLGPAPDMTLRAAVVTPDGRLADEAELDERVCDCCQTAAVATARGVVVAYRDRSPAEVRDIAVVRLQGGQWTEPSVAHRDGWHLDGCPVNGPALAARGSRVALAWYTAAADSPKVLLAFSDDDGATFGRPVRIDEGEPAGRVHLTMLEDGGALVVWLEQQGQETVVRARRVGPAGVPDAPFTVAGAAAVRGFPRVARSGKTLVFAWTTPAKPPRLRTATATLR